MSEPILKEDAVRHARHDTRSQPRQNGIYPIITAKQPKPDFAMNATATLAEVASSSLVVLASFFNNLQRSAAIPR
jgi:hypothetical protein